jgi:hypothetical protein
MTSTTSIARTSLTIGTVPAKYGSGTRRPVITVDVELTPDRLSISGDLKRPGASDIDQGGQIQDTIRQALDAGVIDYAAGWDAERVGSLLDIWERWHLNDMRAGCSHQRAGVATDDDDAMAGTPWNERPIDASKPTDTYGTHFDGQRQASWNILGWVRRDEHPHGLLAFPCPVCGYKYGTSWLTEEIPADVREQIIALTR